MRHYVLTRSAYGPDWDREANRRRLEITRAVTVRLMAAQTTDDWTWIVALDPRDPLLEERRSTFAAAAPQFVPLLWTPDRLDHTPWDSERKRNPPVNSLVAAAAYRAPWRSVMDGGPLLQTRLDDDDGLHPKALERYRRAAEKLRVRTVLMLPTGLRVYGPRFQVISHTKNAMQSLYTPADDDLCIYGYGHTKCHQVAPVRTVDRNWGWIWVRHRDTISGWRETRTGLTDQIRRIFPVDWAVVEAAA